jgi:hypothetical protein
MDIEIIECKISILETPEELGKALVPIGKLLTEIYFDIWALINDINEIIDNMNLVLGDLKILRDDPKYFQKYLSGDPIVRYKLLARTYFYEFFRLKECFNDFLARLRKTGLLNSQDVKEIKSDFYKEFETAIKVRNTMIHNRYLWPGEGHLKLFVTLSAESIGGALVDKLSGEAIQAFLLEGLTVKRCFSNMIKSTTKIVHQAEGCP